MSESSTDEPLPIPPMLSMRIRLLGRFSVQHDDRALAGLDAAKVQELLAYLLIHRTRPLPRSHLAGVLWGDHPQVQAQKYLRQALWQLHAALGPADELYGQPLIVVEPDWVHVNQHAELALDVAVLECAFGKAHGTPGEALEPRVAAELEAALDAYRGELLEGWYQDWCLLDRERLQSMYLAILQKLMGYVLAHGNYDAGFVFGRRILRDDPAHEHTHQMLMRLHYLAGDRTAALRQYAKCVAALDEELGVRPSRRTMALYDQLRGDALPGYAEPQNGPSGWSSARPLPGLLEKLGVLKAGIADLESQIFRNFEPEQS